MMRTNERFVLDFVIIITFRQQFQRSLRITANDSIWQWTTGNAIVVVVVDIADDDDWNDIIVDIVMIGGVVLGKFLFVLNFIQEKILSTFSILSIILRFYKFSLIK